MADIPQGGLKPGLKQRLKQRHNARAPDQSLSIDT